MLEEGRAEDCQLLSAFRDQGVSIHLLSENMGWCEGGMVTVPGKKDGTSGSWADSRPNCNSKVKWVGRSRVIHSCISCLCLPQQGDSGGPLLCAGIAQGIASYVHRNAKPPAVFTRISHYRPWINKILREN